MFTFLFRKNYTKKLARTKALFRKKRMTKAAALVAKMQQDIDAKKSSDCSSQQ